MWKVGISSTISVNWCHLKQGRPKRLLRNSFHIVSTVSQQNKFTMYLDNKSNDFKNFYCELSPSPLNHLLLTIYYLPNTILGAGEKTKRNSHSFEIEGAYILVVKKSGCKKQINTMHLVPSKGMRKEGSEVERRLCVCVWGKCRRVF